MRYRVYTNWPTRRSTVHHETCGYYRHRRADSTENGEWHGPYERLYLAKASDQTTGDVRECSVCAP